MNPHTLIRVLRTYYKNFIRIFSALHNIKIPSLFNQTTTRVLSSDVIINTYMRAGSSFVGKMLGFRKDTFYVYEPLWVFHRYGYYRGKEEVCWTFSPFCRWGKLKSGQIQQKKKMMIFFLFLPEKSRTLILHANCLLVWNVKFYFVEKVRNIIQNVVC